MKKMKWNRFAIAASGLLFSAVVFAGSNETGADSSQESEQENQTESLMPPAMGLYTGLVAGGFYRNLEDNLALAGAVKRGSAQVTGWDWGWGGFNFGMDVGYQFTHALSLELGTVYLQSQKFKFKSGGGTSGTGSYCNAVYCYAAGSYTQLSTWVTYVGIKAQARVWQELSLYTKLAAAYVNSRYRIHLASGSQLVGGGGSAVDDAAADSSYWAPAIAIGAEYRFAEKWRASVQYMLILNGDTLANDPAVVQGRITTINDIAQPTMQLFTAAIEYQFST